MKKSKENLRRLTASLAGLFLTLIFSCFATVPATAQPDEILPPAKHVLPSTIQVNLTKHFARLPLRRGIYQDGANVAMFILF